MDLLQIRKVSEGPEAEPNGLRYHVSQQGGGIGQRAGEEVVAHGVYVVLRDQGHSQVVIGEAAAADHHPGPTLHVLRKGGIGVLATFLLALVFVFAAGQRDDPPSAGTALRDRRTGLRPGPCSRRWSRRERGSRYLCWGRRGGQRLCRP